MVRWDRRLAVASAICRSPHVVPAEAGAPAEPLRRSRWGAEARYMAEQQVYAEHIPAAVAALEELCCS